MAPMTYAREIALYAGGLVLGLANTQRHNRRGYVDPRPFGGSDVARVVRYAVDVVDRLTSRGEMSWSGNRVLEIGPGPDLATGAVILQRGATSYHAVDLFDNRWQASPGLYGELSRVLGVTVDEFDLGFTQTAFPDLPALSGEFDLVVSNACLEHAEQVDRLFERLHELVAPGGSMVHHIDGKAHMRWFRDHDPLNPLRYSDAVYGKLLSFPGAPNRLRASDFVRAASNAGWEARTVPGRRADSDYLARTRVAPRFRRYDDLDLLTFTLVAQRR